MDHQSRPEPIASDGDVTTRPHAAHLSDLPVLRRVADPRLPWSAYLAAVLVGLIIAGGVLALLVTP